MRIYLIRPDPNACIITLDVEECLWLRAIRTYEYMHQELAMPVSEIICCDPNDAKFQRILYEYIKMNGKLKVNGRRIKHKLRWYNENFNDLGFNFDINYAYKDK